MKIFKSLLHSLVALLAGYLVTVILTVVTIGGLTALFPASYQANNMGWVILNIAYGCLYAGVSGYVTARLAPSRPMWHTLLLGGLMALLSSWMAIAVATAPAGSQYAGQPGWYYPALTVLVIPSILSGYAVCAWQKSHTRTAAVAG